MRNLMAGLMAVGGAVLGAGAGCSSGDDEQCACPDIAEPVCGVDGVTYGNACGARCANVEVDRHGDCEEPASVCGNGVLDLGEECDGTDLGGADCGFATSGSAGGGRLSCAADCTFDTSGCACVLDQQSACDCDTGAGGIRFCDADGTYGPCECAVCGDGIVQLGEECDGADFNGETCSSETMGALSGGALTCANCIIDTSTCSAGRT